LSFSDDLATDSIGRVIDYIAIMFPTYREEIIQLLRELNEFLIDIHIDPILAIHGIRKRTKFLRAILRFDSGAYAIQNSYLRKVSHILAPYRDAHVNLETYQSIVEASNELLDPRLESGLQQNPHVLKPLPNPYEIAEIDRLVSVFTRQFQAGSIDPSAEMTYLQINSSFESGQKTLQNAINNPKSETIHSWRKKVKRLWYQLRFLFGDDLEQREHPLVRSQVLGTLLGDIHDLDVFQSLLPSIAGLDLRAFIVNRREQLLVQAFDLGGKLYFRWDPDLYLSLKAND